MAEKRINIGFVGAGWMGGTQLRRLAGRNDVEVLYLLEPNAERGNALLKELGLTRTTLTSEFQQIIDDPRVEAAWLVSPNSFHGPQSIAAMKAGKHVFCEKPCSTRYEDFVRQIELEQANLQLITYVDYILYHDTLEQRLRGMIADGALGKVTQIQVNYRHPINIAGDKKWKLDKQTMGDAIGMGINHAISVIVMAMASQAKPSAVYATSLPAQVRPFEAEAIWNILIRFDNGATGFCFGNIDTTNGYDAYHSISGTGGEFIFDSRLDRPQKVRLWSEQVTGGKWVYPLDEDRCRREGVAAWPADTSTPDSGDVITHQTHQCVDHFLQCVQTGTKSPLSFARSSVIADIGWAAQVSAATGREIKLPLDPHEAEKHQG